MKFIKHDFFISNFHVIKIVWDWFSFLTVSPPFSSGKLLQWRSEEDGDPGSSCRPQPPAPALLPPTRGHVVQRRTEDHPQQQNVGVSSLVSHLQPCSSHIFGFMLWITQTPLGETKQNKTKHRIWKGWNISVSSLGAELITKNIDILLEAGPPPFLPPTRCCELFY